VRRERGALVTRRPYAAVEIDGDDAAWLRGETMPAGYELAELDEVELWGRVYDRAPGSALYVPTDDSPTDRAIERALARVEPEPQPVGISLFTGAGGFDLGMHEAGFDVVAAVEWDADAAVTYLLNLGRPDCEIQFASDEDRRRWEKARSRASKRAAKGKGTDIGGREWIGSGYRASSEMEGGCRAFVFGDISKVSGRQLMEAAGVDDVAVVFGGPPCQGLSTANSQACLEDPRNGMLWEFMRIVTEVRPRTFIIENVPALLSVAHGALFNAIARIANEAGYDVTAQKLNAVWYGVPQHRVRAIIVGTREGSPRYQFPMPSHWALGRPAHGDGWTQVHGQDDEDRTAPALPPEATFDPATRRWSFAGAQPAPADSIETPDVAAQPDLFAGGAP
jgi:site-specific DNA-cytosine methylase